jgi:four helix bundle protein
MTYKRFEDLPVWNDATALSVAVFELTADRRFRFIGDLANQLQRAALSVSSNIAEGFERGTMSELINFLYYARGSAGEVRSILAVAERLQALREFLPQFTDLRNRSEAISRQLGGWLASLRDSSVTGNRSLTTDQRFQQERAQRAGQFMESLRRTVAEAQASRPRQVSGSTDRAAPETPGK